MPRLVRRRVHVEGIVQGVGFRPFVHGVATEFGLAGFVGNDTTGVFAEVEGPPSRVEAFLRRLQAQPPRLAVVEALRVAELPPTGERGFRIVASDGAGARRALVTPDTATCADCLAEVSDPGDRRHGYAFTNCTNCGPRYTIAVAVPYDRSRTTMAGFAMCTQCAAEYGDPADRRFHAEPVCCPVCGPRLALDPPPPDGEDPLEAAVRLLREERVLAVKGLGGYHLAALAGSERAVGTLRARKHREDKPFAVMVADIAAARGLARLNAAEEELLTSAARPIVVLERRQDAALAPSVAPGNRSVGLLLPYTPLHHLLAGALAAPFVLTSGNVSDEPIAYRDEDARERLAPIADALLTHDRPIHTRVDDSVGRVVDGVPTILRRSRGYTPAPLRLPVPATRDVLACGAELKSTVCLAQGRRAFLSHHIGDLENVETLRSFHHAIAHLGRLFSIEPQVVAHDLHPEYLSTKHARELEGVELVGVQHHHAHIASCLADNGLAGPVVGLAFDGLGFGTDGTLWGGEVLVADLREFQRAGHLQTVSMPGGAAAVREPWRMALAFLHGDAVGDLDVRRRNAARWDAVAAAMEAGVNAPRTSSAGRLFDAVAALIGVRDRIRYEGQAAVELEQLADPAMADAYPVPVAAADGGLLEVGSRELVRAVAEDVRRGVDGGVISARFHNGLADAAVEAAARVAAAHGLAQVALSGGVFQNVLLARRVAAGLAARDLEAIRHSRVPPNDGGISLGQAAVAAARGADQAKSPPSTWSTAPLT